MIPYCLVIDFKDACSVLLTFFDHSKGTARLFLIFSVAIISKSQRCYAIKDLKSKQNI